jgi:hypothetical protein
VRDRAAESRRVRGGVPLMQQRIVVDAAEIGGSKDSIEGRARQVGALFV